MIDVKLLQRDFDTVATALQKKGVDSELLNKIKNFGGKLVTIDSSFLEVLLGTTLLFCALQDLSLCDNRILRKDNTIL